MTRTKFSIRSIVPAGALAIVALLGACDIGGRSASLLGVVSDTADLSSLLTVVEYIDANGSQADSADLAALLDSDGPFTVFAPNNAAFVAALDLDGDGDFDTDDVAALETTLGGATATANALYLVVANHVTNGSVLSTDLTDGQEITTLAGSGPVYGLTVSVSGDITVTPSYAPSAAEVVGADVQASNGVAHVIDSVLLDDATAAALGLPAETPEPTPEPEPEPLPSLLDVVVATPDLSSLLTVVQYIDTNGSQADTEDLAALLGGTVDYTVFAPNNAAFAAELDLDIDGDFDTADVAALETRLGSAEATADALYNVVANHVTSGSVLSTGLSAGLAINTLAPDGYPWGLSVNGDVTGVRATFTDAGLTSTIDVEASNGVAHVIDAVLLDDETATALDGAGVEIGSTLVEIVATNPDLEGLLAVITYIDTNGTQADTADLAAILAGSGPFTAFVPVDTAFDLALDLDADGSFVQGGTADSDDIALLEAAIGTPAETADALYLVVANHVTATDELLSTELTDGQVIETLAGSDALYGLTVELDGDIVTVVPSYDPSFADVLAADVQALNGVAHVIDTVLLDDATAAALGLPVDPTD